MCVLYYGRLVVPTVLRKVGRRVPQQDLESLVSESNGRIGLQTVGDVIENQRHRKSLVRRIFRGQRSYESLRENRLFAKQTELVVTIDDLVVKKNFFKPEIKYYNFYWNKLAKKAKEI